MSCQFTLIWDNSAVLASSNATGQRALYRYKTVGGAFISIGFTPTNDLAKSVSTVDSPVLDDNKVIQFETASLCTSGGPTPNDNGIQEVIEFAAITPVITKDDVSSTITLITTGLDITKAKFTLRKSSDNTIVGTPVVVNVVSSSAATISTGLVYSTNYYWQVELYAIVNSVEVISSNFSYIGSAFSPYPFTTNAPAVCNPVTSVTVTSIEI